MSNLIQRIKAPTPNWFKQIINLALTLAAAAGAILGAEANMPGIHLPPFVEKICQALVVAGIAAAAVAKTAKVDGSAQEVTTDTGSTPAKSALPVILLIAFAACLFTGCARKVALSKTTETDTRQLATKTVDTSKSSYSITQTQQAYYGGSLNGTLFFADPTNNTTTNTTAKDEPAAPDLGGGLPKTDSIEANGIKIKVALLPVSGGFKARITAVETPVTVTNTTTQTGAVQKGITQTSAETDKKTVATKAKNTETKGFPWAWLIAACGLAVIIIFVIKKYAK